MPSFVGLLQFDRFEMARHFNASIHDRFLTFALHCSPSISDLWQAADQQISLEVQVLLDPFSFGSLKPP